MDFGPAYETYRGQKIGLCGGKFFPPHKGHVSLALEAATMVDVLFVVVQYDEEYEQGLCANNAFNPVGHRIRERWLTEVFRDYPNIRVLSFPERRSDEYLTDPIVYRQYRELEALIGTVSTVFTSDSIYTEYLARVLPQADHVVLQEGAARIVHCSATYVREGSPYRYWDQIVEPARKYYAKRIAFCGWESSGKSYSAHAMAEQFNAPYLPEYGRTYYEEIGGYGDIELSQDYVNIASGHLMQLHEAPVTKLLMVDTDLIYTQFFYREAYGELHPVLDSLIRGNADWIDLRLFLMPYELDDDGTRHRLTPAERRATALRLRALYEHYDTPVVVIDGTGAERLQLIRRAVATAIA